MSKYLSELQKDHERVLMARSDWNNRWRGFIDGAIERGASLRGAWLNGSLLCMTRLQSYDCKYQLLKLYVMFLVS